MIRKYTQIVCGAALLSGAVTAQEHEQPGAMTADRTVFKFAQAQPAADWYNGFLASFVTNRIAFEHTIFPREYLAVADSWLGGVDWGGGTIQDYTRLLLLEQQVNAEGYVLTQQHPASSHDEGWPFPHWIQVPGEMGFKGVTAGWHFYEEPREWEIVYPHARAAVPEYFAGEAVKRWNVQGLESRGLNAAKSAWELKAVDGASILTSPEGVHLDTFNCPFIQIRWKVEGNADALRPYMEWVGESDQGWSAERRMYFYPDEEKFGGSADTGMFHSMLPLDQHPDWKGSIKRIRFGFQGLENGQPLYVRSIFTHWDTRHLVNNAIYIKAAFEHFRWTGDIGFLREILPRLRVAMRYMMEEGHGLELNYIRCTWHGHDGRPGYDVNPDGSKTWHTGHGKGGNYWDLLPLGWDDMYTTTHYYASLLAMAQLEAAVAENPSWAMPRGFRALEPESLIAHASEVKATANAKFFDPETGRFVGCIDADGIKRDYGFTFLNLEAVHYGIANEKHAKQIMAWVDGKREVEGDTSTGDDIYLYRLAPRATTKRNVEWYAHAWTGPETLPFGGQVQDGGAVLGFSFYDIMSRIKTLGADNAWQRLMEIREWDEEVAAYGGYRKYYGDGKGATTLQGGGTAGGIGIDAEFTESSMLAAVVPLGFMGLQPDGQVLRIAPNLPKDCPNMIVRNLGYQGILMDVSVSEKEVELKAHSNPWKPLEIEFAGKSITIAEAGIFTLTK